MICSRSTLLDKISRLQSAFSSIGGFIAFALDRVDGLWDGYIKLNLNKLFKGYI